MKHGITRDEALALVKAKVKNRNLVRHMLATEAIMKKLARQLNEDEIPWGLAGLLHDADVETQAAKDDPSQHGLIIAKELEAKGIDPDICGAIRAHNEATGEPRDTKIKQAIYATDPLTGLVVAATLVLPDKKIKSLTTDSLRRRFREKSFARGARREAMQKISELGLSLDDLFDNGLEAMQSISDDLGL